MLSYDTLSLDGDMLDEAKAYLRLEMDDDDGPLAAIIMAAIGHAESYTRQILIQRIIRETLSASGRWQALSATPVLSIDGVTGIPADGAVFAVPTANYAADINGDGTAHFRVLQQGAAGRVEISYTAGLAIGWATLPEALRLGILRLIGHFYTHRDAPDDAGPPPAVAALLRPWRRITLL
jgi:uncharacterized phiE125 gp8 family phage protein